MKFILTILAAIALFATTGCIFRGDRDHGDNRGRPGYEHHEEHSGDREHMERQ